MKLANYIEYVDDQDAVAAIRPTRRAFLAGLLESGQLAVAGPFDDSTGTLFVYEPESMEAAKKFAAEDPSTLRRCDQEPDHPPLESHVLQHRAVAAACRLDQSQIGHKLKRSS